MRKPDYSGGGLVNLVAELETRLSGDAPSPRLSAELANQVPSASTYVLVLFDALGDLILRSHPGAVRLATARAGALDASFSTQTSVATATLATGLAPSRHGLIAYLLKTRAARAPVNTLWWFAIDGTSPAIDLGGFLPEPNVAERLTTAGVETVVIEPAAYLGSPLDQVLYRHARTRGVEEGESIARATLEEAASPGRLVVCYLPCVDAAGHVHGTLSSEYSDAIEMVTAVWSEIGEGLPEDVALIGTADHGMIDVAPENRIEIESPPGVLFYGDDRVVYVQGEAGQAREYAQQLSATWATAEEARGLWGPGPFHPELEDRLPVGLIVADDGVALHYPGNELDMVGYHGGLTEAELRIPLLVWDG